MNPLSAEAVDALRVSDIRFERSLVDPGDRPSDAAFSEAERLIAARLVRRLGTKYAPGKGNAVLTVTFRRLRIEGPLEAPDFVRLSIAGTVQQHDLSANYRSMDLNVGRVLLGSGGEIDATERLPMAAKGVADDIINYILSKQTP